MRICSKTLTPALSREREREREVQHALPLPLAEEGWGEGAP